MKFKSIALLFIFSGIFTVSAQEKINEFNKNGDRIGSWIKYYDNGKIRYQGQFEAGKEVGVFKYYSMVSSEHPIVIKTFSKETGIAKVAFYSVEGKLESSGEMDGEKRVGKWFFYLKDGLTLISEEFYINGVLNGTATTYYRNGKITESLNYKDGKLEGSVKRFSDEGVLLDDLNYANGKLEGLAKYYNTFGKLRAFGNYENDLKVGKWQYFENEEPINPNKINNN